MFFEVQKLLEEIFFFQADSLEVERLTVGERGFAVYWVATAHAEVLVLVRGLHMQVSLDLVISAEEPYVEKDDFFS